MTAIGIERRGSRPAGATRRPRGVLGVGWACIESAMSGRSEHRPTSADYAESVVRRVSFEAGGGLGWRISALATPRSKAAPWKIVVITGAPSWAEYWAPVMAALPQDREMIVVDRPGYGQSEPASLVGDIAVQAEALAPLLTCDRGQRIMLVGQSYGAGIAALMAARSPKSVASLVLLSSYLGECGPTARWLVDVGARLKGVIPRDLRTAVAEVSGQASQLGKVRDALAAIPAPIHIIHGDADDFAPLESALRWVEQIGWRRPVRFQAVGGAGHFFNDGPCETVLDCLERCISRPGPWPVEKFGALASRLARPFRAPGGQGSNIPSGYTANPGKA